MADVGEPVTFESEGLRIEGRLHAPASEVAGAVVVCHPHPLYGGDMDNNVVLAICGALTDIGAAALRFNFRGVAGSAGEHSEGPGESADARAALDFLAARGYERLALAGYSFGAVIALTLAGDPRLAAVAAVSAPVGRVQLEAPDGFRPLLLVTGDRDDIAPAGALREFAAPLGEACRVLVIEGADHFWWGREASLGAAVAPFLVAALTGRSD